MSRARALARLGGAAMVVGCVDIATGPGGIDSIRLDTRAHAIVAGDSLRDSTGAVTSLRASAFDENGNVVRDASFRFIALPTRSGLDTTTLPSGLVVDSLTGTVRAVAPRPSEIGRVAINVGGKLQLIDTLRIVPRPTTLTRTAPDSVGAASRLVFSCSAALTDRTESLVSAPITGLFSDSAYVGNYLALATRLTSDSSGTALPVPGFYVRYTIVSPTSDSIPLVALPSGAVRPAIGIVTDAQSDRASSYDTTDANGTSTVALRVFGRALGAPAFATRDVRIRAQARRSTTDTLRSVDFVVHLRRVFSLTDRSATTCPTS